MSVTWGLLSTANINASVLAAARGSDRADVVAVASRDARRAEEYAREHGIERAHGSYEALLEDPDVEAVYISLPNALHVIWTLRALEAGKHVLCEKPLTRHAHEAERAFDAAERSGLLLMEAFMWRHSHQTQRLSELVAEGAIGRVGAVRAAFAFSVDDPVADVRMLPELDGGALMDVGCYCLSAARLVAGEPERVHGEQVLTDAGVDARFAATLRFPGDVIAQFDCGLTGPARAGLEVIGSEGSLFLGDPWHAREPGIEVRTADGVNRIEIEPVDAYRLELENLGDAIRSGAAPLLGRDDALGQARAIEALYRSAEQGRSVSI